MYKLQYWNERDAEWRGAGFWSDDHKLVRLRMRGASEECGGCVRFRIVEDDPLAGLSDEEYAQATTPA